MNVQTARIIALICAAAIGSGALAQSATSGGAADPQAAPTPAPKPTQDPTPPPVNPTAPTDQAANSVNAPPAATKSQAPATSPAATVNPKTIAMNDPNQVFISLDTGRKGFLSQADVAPNPYLSTNFQQCDTNNDEHLTQSEVSACMQNMPPPHE